mmetsp:Transcript_40198/g.82735  ORF Transcript_40198/g.82735 Transcript_40198/m.82735 type:complete len:175 (-) Transcript_40198:605-1129(-)
MQRPRGAERTKKGKPEHKKCIHRSPRVEPAGGSGSVRSLHEVLPAFFSFLLTEGRKATETMALRMMTEKVMGFAAKQYQSALGASLATTGLRYEDLLNEGERDISEALSLAEPDVLTGRTRRIKRALDLGFKRKNLQDYAPDMELDMFKSEIYETVEKLRSRDQEYALLNAHNK